MFSELFFHGYVKVSLTMRPWAERVLYLPFGLTSDVYSPKTINTGKMLRILVPLMHVKYIFSGFI